MSRMNLVFFLVFAGGVMSFGCNDEDSSSDDVWTQTDVQADVGEDDGVMGTDQQDEELAPSCTSQCAWVGEKTCATENSWAECLPEGACLSWGEPTVCDVGEECQEGGCVHRYGDQDCIAVSKCVATCDGVESCQQDCFYEGSPEGQADFEAFLTCTDVNCSALFEQEKLAAGSQCTLANCETEYQACVETGTASCSDTLKCMQNCNQDGTCLADCAKLADFDALVKLTNILVCFEDNCPDPATWQTCATSTCLMPSLACL